MSEHNLNIENKSIEIEARIYAQEHRLFHIIRNLIVVKKKYPKNDPRRVSINKAVFWLLFSPTTLAIISTGVISYFTIFFMYRQTELIKSQNSLFESQNELFENQNKNIEMQTHLIEGSRRSTYLFLMGDVLDDMYKEIKQIKSSKKTLSSGLTSRIISLSRSMKPYRYLEQNSLILNPLSPERGQLLMALLDSELDDGFLINEVFEKANFTYSDLNSVRIKDRNLSNINLNNSKLVNSIIWNCNLSKSNLRYCDFENAYLSNTKFENSNLKESNLTNAKLYEAKFKGAYLKNTILNKAYLDNADFTNATLLNIDFNNVDLSTVFSLDSIKVSRSDWTTYLKDSLKIQGSEYIFDNYKLGKEIKYQWNENNTLMEEKVFLIVQKKEK